MKHVKVIRLSSNSDNPIIIRIGNFLKYSESEIFILFSFINSCNEFLSKMYLSRKRIFPLKFVENIQILFWKNKFEILRYLSFYITLGSTYLVSYLFIFSYIKSFFSVLRKILRIKFIVFLRRFFRLIVILRNIFSNIFAVK